MLEIPPWFPGVLSPALPADPTLDVSALIAAPDLEPFWQALAKHVSVMLAMGWRRSDAVGVLVGSVLSPLSVGYDFDNTLARRVRDGVDMARRAKAAALARELAELLGNIEGEPLAPGGVLSVLSLLEVPGNVQTGIPSYFYGIRSAEALQRLAEALETPPDFAEQPGLASQKSSWRGFIREVQASLEESDFTLRERDAVALVKALAIHSGRLPPSRGSVRDALRSLA